MKVWDRDQIHNHRICNRTPYQMRYGAQYTDLGGIFLQCKTFHFFFFYLQESEAVLVWLPPETSDIGSLALPALDRFSAAVFSKCILEPAMSDLL